MEKGKTARPARREWVREAAILTAAIAIIAAAVFFFLVPSHAAVSSISGAAIVLANFIPLPISSITMILNVALLLAGFATCGNEFGVKTVYTSILLPLFLGVLERAFPDYRSLTDSPELDVICYILVVSVGLSILFNRNASSGGLDIVAKMLNKYLHIDLGKAMSVSGMMIALSSALVYEALGAYTLKPQREIITIVDKNEYQKLMQFINRLDPDAFVTVYTVSNMRYKPKA